jgi:hypothetical protein
MPNFRRRAPWASRAELRRRRILGGLPPVPPSRSAEGFLTASSTSHSNRVIGFCYICSALLLQ